MRQQRLFAGVIVVMIGAGCQEPCARQAITSVLIAQRQAWNRGDIEGFVDHYLKSDALTFSADGTTTRGWDATLQRYYKRYPDRQAMGQLQFDELEIVSLGQDSAYVLGRWHLEREPKNIGGRFTLVVRLIHDRWVIVHDHTSVAVD